MRQRLDTVAGHSACWVRSFSFACRLIMSVLQGSFSCHMHDMVMTTHITRTTHRLGGVGCRHGDAAQTFLGGHALGQADVALLAPVCVITRRRRR
jgi:hypothetical protein